MVKATTPKKEKKEVIESVDISSSENEDEYIEGMSDEESEQSENDEDDKQNKHKVKKLKNKKKATETGDKKKNGRDEYSSIIYVSRLPHGFHERELSKYFSQFGDLREVRLARNKKTGNSRHYGFIEFVNKDDAKIAQETMNNYLLMGHLLQVRLLNKGAKIAKLYKYRKRAFMEPTVVKTAKQLKKESNDRHNGRFNKLADAGIDFKW